MSATTTAAETQSKTPTAPVVAKQPETPEKASGPEHAAPTTTASSGAASPSPNDPHSLKKLGQPEAGATSRARRMITLQRSIGNNRVSNLIDSAIQTKLAVGETDDPQEREADRVAETITQSGSNSQPPAQRQVVMNHSLSQPIRRVATGKDHEAVDANMEQRITSPSGGQPLPNALQREMEAGFNTDFSNVRVHDSTEDQADASRLSAKAFTHGEHIWLGAGESAGDRKLMAHELTHVVQQGGTSGVTQELPDQTASRTVMRFVGTEHAALGDTTGETINLGDGIVLTWGQVVGIAGDEYRTVEELETAVSTPAGRARLRAALEDDGVPGSVTTRLPAPTPDQVSAQGSEFLRLAMENVTHFPDAGAALSEWAAHHTRALQTALAGGLANNPAAINRAYLFEAFGQHFLTDAFSGGHIRTPRTQMVDWYTRTFAPRVVNALIANLRERLIDGLVAQASPQTSYPDFIIRRRVTSTVTGVINGLIADAGGMPAVTRWVGLGVAGAISGAIHDAEGRAGVLVSSDAHPVPWRAFGDQRLRDSPVSEEQARMAIATAKADVDQAYRIGEAEAITRTRSADDPPSIVHFAFNSSALEGDAAQAVQTAAAQMIYNPEARVQVVGHTDPIGLDHDNEALGLRRANAIRDALLQAGIDPVRVSSRSEGERALLTTNPPRFALNRRVEFYWRSQPSGINLTDPQEIARQRAQRRAESLFQAPYPNVTRFVPRPVEERGGTGNTPLPDWHWGSLSAATRALVDDWIRSAVTTRLNNAISSSTALNDRTVEGITVRPRDVARGIVRGLLANPTATVGDLTEEAPGP